MGMRYVFTALLFTAAACSTPAEPWPVVVTERSPVAVSDAGSEHERAQHLCFRITDELSELVPTIRQTFSVAVHRWGWTVIISDECESVLAVGDVSEAHGAAVVTHAHYVDGTELSAAFVGGASRITLDREALATEYVADVDEQGCEEIGARHLLVRVLAHEVGHILLIEDDERDEHSDDPDDVMATAGVARPCEDAWPSASQVRLGLVG
jgi:hypothetical protein